jgi:hypothetical protein
MLGETLWQHLNAPEFQPFTIVLANGERIDVIHPDSVTIPTAEFRGRRVFGSMISLLETKDNEVIERAISLPLIAQIVKRYGMNGH